MNERLPPTTESRPPSLSIENTRLPEPKMCLRGKINRSSMRPQAAPRECVLYRLILERSACEEIGGFELHTHTRTAGRYIGARVRRRRRRAISAYMVHWSLSRRTDGRGPLPSGVWGKGLPAVAHPTAINNRFFLDAEDGCHAQVYSSIKESLTGRKRRAEWKLLSDAQFLHFEASKLSWFYILPSSGFGSTLLFVFFYKKKQTMQSCEEGGERGGPPGRRPDRQA